jgi:hypothetical protein
MNITKIANGYLVNNRDHTYQATYHASLDEALTEARRVLSPYDSGPRITAKKVTDAEIEAESERLNDLIKQGKI